MLALVAMPGLAMIKYSLAILTLVMFTSCSKDHGVRKHEQIVNDADQIRFLVQDDNDFKVVRDVTAKKDLDNLKNILIMDIKAEDPKKLFPNKKFEFIKSGQTLGHLMILDNGPDPFALVKIEGEKDFGFRLPYRIGMYPN